MAKDSPKDDLMGLPVEPTGISLIWFIIFIFKIWADFVTTYGILLHCSGNLDFVSSAKFSFGMDTVQEKSYFGSGAWDLSQSSYVPLHHY